MAPLLAGQANQGANGSSRTSASAGPIGLARKVIIDLGAVGARHEEYPPVGMARHGHPGLFPALDADIEIAPLGDGPQLAMSARYDPPLGLSDGARSGGVPPGRRGDREGLPRPGRGCHGERAGRPPSARRGPSDPRSGMPSRMAERRRRPFG